MPLTTDSPALNDKLPALNDKHNRKNRINRKEPPLQRKSAARKTAAEKAVDPRHTPVKKHIETTVQRLRLDLPWSAGAAGALATLLRGYRDRPGAALIQWVDNWADSDAKYHADMLPEIIAALPKFQLGWKDGFTNVHAREDAHSKAPKTFVDPKTLYSGPEYQDRKAVNQ